MNANLLFQKMASVQPAVRSGGANSITQGKSRIEDKDSFRRLLEKMDGKSERPDNTKSATETRQTSSQESATTKAGDGQDAEQARMNAAQVLMALLLNLVQETGDTPEGTVEVNDSTVSGQPAVLSAEQMINLLQTLPEDMKKDLVKLAQLLDGSAFAEKGGTLEVLKGLPLPRQADPGELAQWLQEAVSRLAEDQQENAAVVQVKDNQPVPVLEAAAAKIQDAASVQKTGEAKEVPDEAVPVDTVSEPSQEASLSGAPAGSEDSHKGEKDTQSQPDVSWLKTVVKALDAAGVSTRDSVATGAMTMGNVKLPADQAAPMPEVVVIHNGRVQPELLVKPVIQHASVMIKEGISEMRLQLVPENLGKVHLQISVRDGIVSAKMTVDNEQVRAIMETNLSQLKDALQEQGLQLGGFSVACGQQQGGQWAAQEREAMLNNWSRGNRAKAEESYQLAGSVEGTPTVRSSVWSEGIVDALV